VLGTPIVHGGRNLRVVKIGGSPLPGDLRRCAFLVRS
jgi:hypothetical protein